MYKKQGLCLSRSSLAMEGGGGHVLMFRAMDGYSIKINASQSFIKFCMEIGT